MILHKRETLLFTGDSITDCDRDRPVGEGQGVGNGYVAIVRSLLWATYPELQLRILNTGISGNRVIDLKERWERDVLAYTPDWVSIMIGINDVWRQFDSPNNPIQVDETTYRTSLSSLVDETTTRGSRVILMTPFFIERSTADPMREMMDGYGAIVKEIADANGTYFVDAQRAFDRYLSINPSQTLCGDRVHPNMVGHAVLAREFLNAIGYEWAGSS